MFDRDTPESSPADELCAICLERRTEVRLSCSHYLCSKCPKRCANPWLRCPFCRQHIYQINLLDNVSYEHVDLLYMGVPSEEPSRMLDYPDDDNDTDHFLSTIQELDLFDYAVTVENRTHLLSSSRATSLQRLRSTSSNKIFEHFGTVPESQYTWQLEMEAYGSNSEQRRRTSLDKKLRTSRKWNENLITALSRRNRHMPESMCRSCFATCRIADTVTLCCNRLLCIQCISSLATTQVDKCVIGRVRGLMHMPRCPLCNFKPMSDKSRLIPLKKYSPAANSDATNVISGTPNFVALEADGDLRLFTDENVKFAKYFWTEILLHWPEIGYRNEKLSEWLTTGN